MTHEIVSVICGGGGPVLPGAPRVRRIMNRRNRVSPCQAYQRALDTTSAEILVMLHDDLTVHEDEWLVRIMNEFDRDETVAVGLGGAVGLANQDLYRKPFMIGNMARVGYMSNQTDAEVHGSRQRGRKQVAVLEQFAMAIRADWIRSRGGWPVGQLTHHCLDMWLGCEAARDGKELWMTGASVTHHGGGSSIGPEYANAKWLQGGSLELDHLLPHKWIFNEYRDVLPLVLK